MYLVEVKVKVYRVLILSILEEARWRWAVEKLEGVGVARKPLDCLNSTACLLTE